MMFKNEKAFTLIEMLIVLSIITILLLLVVPNVIGKGKNINETGCKALVSVVQAQVSAFELEKGKLPATLNELEGEGFITEEQLSCNGNSLVYDKDKGIVSIP